MLKILLNCNGITCIWWNFLFYITIFMAENMPMSFFFNIVQPHSGASFIIGVTVCIIVQTLNGVLYYPILHMKCITPWLWTNRMFISACCICLSAHPLCHTESLFLDIYCIILSCTTMSICFRLFRQANKNFLCDTAVHRQHSVP